MASAGVARKQGGTITAQAIVIRLTAITCCILSAGLLWRDARLWVEAAYLDRNPKIAVELSLNGSSIDQALPERVLQSSRARLRFDPAGALPGLQQALARDPINSRLWGEYATAAFYAGERELGERASLHALELAPKTSDVLIQQIILASVFTPVASAELNARWQQAADFASVAWPLKLIRHTVNTGTERQVCALLSGTSPLTDWCIHAATRLKLCELANATSSRRSQNCPEALPR